MSTLDATKDRIAATGEHISSMVTGTTDTSAAKHQKADAEDQLSHSALKGPGFTATAGAVTRDDPERTKGKVDQIIGPAKESVGKVVEGVTGQPSELTTEGQQQRAEGETRESAGILSDLASGAAQRVTGLAKAAAATLIGNPVDQEAARQDREEGKARQRGAEKDL